MTIDSTSSTGRPEQPAVSTDIRCPMKVLTRAFMHDPYPMLTALRDTGPAAVAEVNGLRMWLVTRYHDVKRVLADPAFSKDIVQHRKRVMRQCVLHPERIAKMPLASRRSLLDRDGADHKRLRALLSGQFSPARVAGYRPRIEQITDELLDRLPVGEPVDLVNQFARPLVTTFISEVFGVPEGEREGFPVWENDMLTAPSKAGIEEATRKLHELALRLVEIKRREPGDDVFTLLLRKHDEDGVLDHDELASTFLVLLVGGSEPTSAIGNGLLHLLSNPSQLAAVRADPSRYAACVDEVLRYESPFRMLAPRLAERAVELDGVTIPAGELVMASVAAANRDPVRFADPERFDVTRDARGHLGFGHGPHRCLGSELGRLETTIALRALVERFPGSRLAVPPDQVRWRPGMFMRRLDSLPAVLG